MFSVLIVLVLAFLSLPTILFAAGIAGIDFGTIWSLLVNFPMDHPISLLVIAFLAQKLGPISWFLLWVLKAVRDKLFDDTEAAGALWHLAALISGLWPNKSRGIILKYAPRHWRSVILEGQAPTFRLVAVPLDKIYDVQNMLLGKGSLGDQPVTNDEGKADTPGPGG